MQLRQARWIALCLILPLSVIAEDYPLGLSATDPRGCYLSNSSIGGATLHLMTAAHSDPSFDAETARALIRQAVAAGCDLHETDAEGLMPLNAAILFNDAVLVELLLTQGSDPLRTIHSTRSNIHGLDSLGWLSLLEQRQPERDRSALRQLLDK